MLTQPSQVHRPIKPDAEQHTAFLPLSIARMVWKRKLLIVSVAAAVSALAAGVTFKLPAQYRAEALILVDSQKIPEKFVSSTVSSGVTDRLAAISQEIMSTTQLLKIINDFGLYKTERNTRSQEELVEQMRHDININVQKDNWATGKPVAFKVGYQGENPTLVSEVTNQLANLYIEQNLQTREVEATGTSEFIDHELADAKKELDQQEAKVAQFKARNNGALPEQENPLLSTLSNLRIQLQGVQDAINRSQQSKVMTETALATEQSLEANLDRGSRARAAGEAVNATEEEPQSRQETLVTLQKQLRELESRYTPEYPDILTLKAEIAELQEVDSQQRPPQKQRVGQKTNVQVSETEHAFATRELLQERGKVAMMQAQAAELKHNIAAEEAERDRILQDINAAEAKVDRLPTVEQAMVALTRDYETSKLNYNSLLDKQIAAQMAADMERRQKSERFEIIDPARVPEKPFKPNRPVWLGGGVIIALALGLAAGLGMELREFVLLGEWEFPDNVVILGRVPVIDMQPGSGNTPRQSLKAFVMCSGGLCLLGTALALYFLKAKL